ncbi:MAG: hypothetical protein AAF630_07690 [Cyanobacteria bacterium P01_C01_bin.38]
MEFGNGWSLVTDGVWQRMEFGNGWSYELEFNNYLILSTTNYQLPITNYLLPMPNALSPMPKLL